MNKRFVLFLFFFYCTLISLISAEQRGAKEPLEIIHSNLKLILYPESMSFSLYQLSDVGKGRYTALFEDRNASATSWFSVQSGSKVFKLTRRHGKSGILEQTDGGARFIFDLTDDFQAIQSFSFIDSKDSDSRSLLKIETSIENTSGKPSQFALKAFIDTFLGENQGVHFSTNIKDRISTETMLTPYESMDSVLISKNREASLMILLKGSNVSVPSSVYVANWDRLNTLSWTHEYHAGRSFNSLYAINDSAVVIQWPSIELSEGNIVVYTALLGTYSDYWISFEKKGTITNASPIIQSAQLTKQKSKQQLLIEKLLERIREIELNPDVATEEELLQLNNALDVLLNQGS